MVASPQFQAGFYYSRLDCSPLNKGILKEIEMKCPICGCQRFYLKSPEDEYETYPFELKDGEICFDPGVEPSEVSEVDEKEEAFCDRCAWHGPFQEIKK